MLPLQNILQGFNPISLSAMSAVKLMNRVDTKFVAPFTKLVPFLEMLLQNYRVQEITSSRFSTYRTLYYDTPDKEMYLTHQNGKATRRKVRMREYVDNDQYFFEIKNKNNRGRTKKTRKSLPEWNNFRSPELEPFLQKYTPYLFNDLIPHLQTAFDRITLVNKQMTERLTIDFNLRFSNVDTNTDHALSNVIIIELKQDGLADSFSRHVLREMRIHPMGFSKYCIGVALTNPAIRQNNLKERLHIVDKMNSITNNNT